jgi:hypothetical protein
MVPLKLDVQGRPVVFARQAVLGPPNAQLQRAQDQTWPADLSHAEVVALQIYTDTGYEQVNRDLREHGKVHPPYRGVHEHLQSAFRKAKPFDPPVLVSRGISIDPFKLNDFLAGYQDALKTGKPYTIPGYVSTTIGPKIVPPFDRGNVHLHIKAVHGLDVFPLTHYAQERELLLNHSSTFKVVDIRSEGDRWIIHLEQLPPPPAKMGADKAGAVLPTGRPDAGMFGEAATVV